MKWAPNFTYPAAKARATAKIRQACGWAYMTLSNGEQVLSKGKIDKKLGRSNDNMGNYLRNKLLICVDAHIKFSVAGEKGIAKRYVLNLAGYTELMQVLNDGLPLPADYVPSMQDKLTKECVDEVIVRERVEYKDEIEAMRFKMAQKGECPRLFHNLQHMPKDIKDIFWKGKLDFNYDVQSCAPTLIYQQAKHLGLNEECAAIDTLLGDPKKFRENLADRIGLTYKQAKVIVNALFCGATLGRGSRFELFHLIGCSLHKMNALRSDVWLIALREEIKACWDVIGKRGEIPRRKNKKGHWMPLRCKNKWNYYFKLERMVLDSVTDYLTDQGIAYFTEHDGWRTNMAIDIHAIEAYVSGNLGFNIKISGICHEDHSSDAIGVMRCNALSLPDKQDNSHAQATNDDRYVFSNNLLSTPLLYDDDTAMQQRDIVHG